MRCIILLKIRYFKMEKVDGDWNLIASEVLKIYEPLLLIGVW